jgi:uncharacterized protein YbbC (DUF1343 family)
MIKLVVIIALLAAGALNAQVVKTGIDNLIDTRFNLLDGKRVVLVSHAAARAASGRSTLEEFLRAPNVRLLRVLAPEHGYDGIEQAGNTVADDASSPLPILSLYGAQRRPGANLISDADVVVVDLQDVGTRSYTYVSTMVEVMEACSAAGIWCVVLDRPNPLGGVVVDGSLPDSGMSSFVCRIPVPYVHGMTMGEMASMTNGEGWLERNAKGQPRTCSLTVVRCKLWLRGMIWEQTGLHWYPTSPNIPTPTAARGYPVTGLLGELGLCSIGIGTTTPFCVVGAPDFARDTVLESRLRRHGVIPRYGKFQPTTGRYKGQKCSGYHLACTTDSTLRPFTAAMALIARVRDGQGAGQSREIEVSKHPMFLKVCGSRTYLELLANGASWQQIEASCSRGVEDFKARRLRYLLY